MFPVRSVAWRGFLFNPPNNYNNYNNYNNDNPPFPLFILRFALYSAIVKVFYQCRLSPFYLSPQIYFNHEILKFTTMLNQTKFVAWIAIAILVLVGWMAYNKYKETPKA